MKTIYIIRHAKSSWDNPSLSDFDRPLNPRGLKTAPMMGTYLSQKGINPDIILSSPALRAAETAHLLKNAASWQAEISFDERIYEASPQTLHHIVKELDGKIPSVLIIGHNPGIESFIRLLTNRVEAMPTCSFAHIVCRENLWSDVRPGDCDLVEIIRPKEIAPGIAPKSGAAGQK
jgi:phosphohistidine phosphatase